MAEFNLLQLPNDKIEELILKILKLMLSNSNSDNILDQLADTLTTLLQKNLKLKLILVRLVSDYAEKVANLRTTSISIVRVYCHF
jgi:hypothetical protein